MAQIAVENNFINGLRTEFTGLSFPEHAATETQNCVFEVTGDVHRRAGFDFEANFNLSAKVVRTNLAINTYKWNNAGGDGNTQIVVTQVGKNLTFYRSSTATNASPLSSQSVGTPIDISTYVATGGSFDATIECQFADGNGYLFVYHPSCDPFFIQYNPIGPVLTATVINIKIRDFEGIVETGVDDTTRALTLSADHQYNLENQGWGKLWSATSTTSNTIGTGSKTWTLAQTGLPIALGDRITVAAGGTFIGSITSAMIGIVTAYSGTTLTLNVTSVTGSGTFVSWAFASQPTYIFTWFNAIGNYPSNSDVWWLYKNTSNVFDPATTINNITLDQGASPKGFMLLNAWTQHRDTVSGVSGLSNTGLNTTVRPKTGTFFQGRVWYGGADVAGATEQIYFSQIIEHIDQFGMCYQVNDPTSQDRFDLLPTDGGTIKIQGMGSLYRLFPVQNGMLVFAANGIWFITGSTGIGFAANDYTITKISAVRSISGTSFVDVNGWPMFWNEEGIYNVTPGQSGGLTVNLITYRTIASFYDAIPFPSRKYARGAYNPLTYTIQWIYKTTQETGVTDRYNFDGILNLNVGTQAWFPWTISTSTNFPYVHGVNYVAGPGGLSTPDPINKYFCSFFNAGLAGDQFTFAEERDDVLWKDWNSINGVPLNYVSDFISGFRLHGDAIKRFQPEYIMVFSGRTSPARYKFQGLWNYANNVSTGKFTTIQIAEINSTKFEDFFKRFRCRGQGVVFQLKIASVDGYPFDIIGWSTWETKAKGV